MQYCERNVGNVTSKLEGKQLTDKNTSWGCTLHRERHANCSNQGFKCFATHLSWDRQPSNFPKFWSSQSIFLYFKTAHGRISLLCKNNVDETSTLIQRINNCISWSPPYRSVNNWGKTKICKKHQTFEEIGQKSKMKMHNVARSDADYFSTLFMK